MTDHIHIQQLISAEYDGQATTEEKKLIEAHLNECESCRAYARELHQLSAVLDEWDNEDLSPDLEQKIQGGLKEDTMGREHKGTYRPSLFKVGIGGGGALVAILVLVISMQTYSQRSLQSRVRDAADYLSTPSPVQDAEVGRATHSQTEGPAPVQYEPYYLTTDYAVGKDKGAAPREAQMDASGVRAQGGSQTSTYSGALLAEGLGGEYDGKARMAEKKKSQIVYNQPVTSITKETFAAGVTRSELSKAEVTTDVMDSQIINTNQEFWGGGNERFKNVGNVVRRDIAQAKAPQSAMVAGATLQGFGSGDAQYKSDDSRRFNESRGEAEYPVVSEAIEPGDTGTEVMDGIGRMRRERLKYQDRYYPAPPPKRNTEEYAQIYENPFLDARQSPLSTFSIDVDTTSYSNVRRFLNQGQMPPPDAVRIEEMINYFSYDYPEPGWGKPLSVTTEAAFAPWNRNHYLVRVGLKGKVPTQKTIPPSNLVFLIDVSGSMNQANKLPLLKRAFHLFVDQLSANERVAIVVYSGNARMVLDSTSGSDKWRIKQAIDQLQAGGSTAGSAGIHLAYNIAARNFIRNGNNRVILATDGDFNVGVSSNDALVRLIEQKRQQGVFLSILGFGTGNYKDAKMEQIADKGNGNYFYIDSIKEGRKVLVEELGSTLFTIAKDVKLQVEFNPAEVAAYRLIGYENRTMAAQDFNNDKKDAGELGAGHTVTALYEVIPAPAAVQRGQRGVDSLRYQEQVQGFFTSQDLMTVKFRYKDPNGNKSKLIKTVIHRRDITNSPSRDYQFASAVAEFGMLLRNSRYKGHASYDQVANRARYGIQNDSGGHKAEFLRMVQQAKNLDYRRPYPVPYDEPYPQPYPAYDGPTESNMNFKSE